ncbi:hypothetical protein BKA67DRAFT_541506 [Truncatella angustata]|uniref:Uncharacterized protein n=1 Tax=Truncatella angustata TaxID=152316 RepID=A0A9P8U8J8_9PEZI|nr:uncharacterized protein BKA67DRAFT_541506 [Truncatella angustata]KAH6645274.1 hypothetical protein BKA67DRAFT_541506 [Truncatella angustata]
MSSDPKSPMPSSADWVIILTDLQEHSVKWSWNRQHPEPPLPARKAARLKAQINALFNRAVATNLELSLKPLAFQGGCDQHFVDNEYKQPLCWRVSRKTNGPAVEPMYGLLGDLGIMIAVDYDHGHEFERLHGFFFIFISSTVISWLTVAVQLCRLCKAAAKGND